MPPSASASSLDAALKDSAAFMEQWLDRLLPFPTGPEGRVAEAMRYSALGGGKRLRPFLVLETAGLFGVSRADAGRAACAVECIHVYSLIHDDLPAMDNDDLRRGKPTAHKAFDEATAILAGDALLTFAFEILGSTETHKDGRVRCDLVLALARAAGQAGMIGGQMMDIALEGRAPGFDEVTRLQRMKTGDLITFSCEAGAILGEASSPSKKALIQYGRCLGSAFQIADDLLDAEGDPALMGKAARKDSERGKPTVVAALGVTEARKRAEMMAMQARSHLDSFGEKADLLRELATFVVQRQT